MVGAPGALHACVAQRVHYNNVAGLLENDGSCELVVSTHPGISGLIVGLNRGGKAGASNWADCFDTYKDRLCE